MADNGSKTTSAPPTKAERAPWTVQDTNCKPEETRTHEIVVDGLIKAYPFKYGVELSMPEGNARKFMHDPAFIVKNPEGRRVKPAISITRGFDASGNLILADDECVARLEELSMESLLDRAAPMKDGEKLSLKSGKAAVIKFLTEARRTKIAQNISPVKDLAVDEMSDLDFKRMAELEEV